jgi:hypothetical protein
MNLLICEKQTLFHGGILGDLVEWDGADQDASLTGNMHGGIVHVHPVLGVQDGISVGVHAHIGLAVFWPFTDDDHVVVLAHHWDQHGDGGAGVLAFAFLQLAASLVHLLRVEGKESLVAKSLDQVFACWVDGSHGWEVDAGLADVVLDFGEVFGHGDVEFNPFGVGHTEILVLGSGSAASVLNQGDQLVAGASLGHPQSQNLDSGFLVQAFQVLGLVEHVPDAFGLGLDDSHFDEGGVVGVGHGCGVHFGFETLRIER